MALLTADIVVASTTARFALREINSGLGGVVNMIYSVGRPRGLFMAMTGAWVQAEQAEQWGLIYKCTKPEKLDAKVDTVARMLEELPPLGVAATKQRMAFISSLQNQQALTDFCAAQNKVLHSSADRKEAQTAFLEKRKPKFQGR